MLKIMTPLHTRLGIRFSEFQFFHNDRYPLKAVSFVDTNRKYSVRSNVLMYDMKSHCDIITAKCKAKPDTCSGNERQRTVRSYYINVLFVS